MEMFYEEYEGKVWKEEDIRKELFNQIIDKQQKQIGFYLNDKDVETTLDADNEILKLATKGKIEDVIEELTNVNSCNFINVDEIIDSEKFTNNVDNLKKAIEFFGKYYRACNGVKNTFEYQCINSNYVNNLEDLVNELTSIDYTLEKMEREFE